MCQTPCEVCATHQDVRAVHASVDIFPPHHDENDDVHARRGEEEDGASVWRIGDVASLGVQPLEEVVRSLVLR